MEAEIVAVFARVQHLHLRLILVHLLHLIQITMTTRTIMVMAMVIMMARTVTITIITITMVTMTRTIEANTVITTAMEQTLPVAPMRMGIDKRKTGTDQVIIDLALRDPTTMVSNSQAVSKEGIAMVRVSLSIQLQYLIYQQLHIPPLLPTAQSMLTILLKPILLLLSLALLLRCMALSITPHLPIMRFLLLSPQNENIQQLDLILANQVQLLILQVTLPIKGLG